MAQSGMVIVGAGEAGARAAFALREEGWTGEITLVGEEPHAPYERPPLSKAALTDEAPPRPKYVAEATRFAEAKISTRFGQSVTDLDRGLRRLRLADGTVLDYTKLLIATGARPRPLPPPGADGPHCLMLRRFEDAVELRRRIGAGTSVVIIGGGFIGLELAASARARGAGVTLIEALPRLLNRGVPADIGAAVEARHRKAGVRFRIGTGIAGIENTSAGATAVLADGERIAADLIVIGIGSIPETGLAATAGLTLDNGIAVDSRLRTSDPDIFAAGDCCSYPLPHYGDRRVRLESWRNAQDQGSHAARAMLGSEAAFATVPWFWSDQYDLGLQVAGLIDEGSRTIRRDLAGDAFILFHLNDSGRLVAASGIGPGTMVARDIRLAELLVARHAEPSPALLADPAGKLKSLLAA